MIADVVGLESYQLRKELNFFLYDSTGKTWEHWGKVIELSKELSKSWRAQYTGISCSL